MKKHLLWWRRLVSRFSRKRRLVVVAGDSLPDILPRRDLVLARDDGEDWCVGLYCPCGCGDKLEMIVLEGVKPRWDVLVDGKGHVSLRPSVWRQNGCKSHFWVIGGKILWCD
jgi:hypothetical protein